MKPLFLIFPASLLTLAACSPASDPPAPAPLPPPVEQPLQQNEPVAETPAPVELVSVYEITAQNPDFSTLHAVIQAADLAETLKGQGPFTVFAPTNAAFAALPSGTLDQLLLPENKDQLVRIAGYHVIPGKVLASEAPAEADGKATASSNNLDLSFRRAEDGTIRVNEHKVTTADVEASNGVIHIVDGVLMPRMEE